MSLAKLVRHFGNSAIDRQHPLRSAARWPRWLYACARGRPVTARFATGGLRMTLVPRLHSFGTTSIWVKRDRYEPELLAVGRLIAPGDVVLDIGASFGIFTCFMAHFAGPDGRVHAFEPGAFSFGQLSRNVALNRFQHRVVLHNAAAADRPARLALFQYAGSPVNFSLGGSGGKGVASEPVAAVRVDQAVPAADAARVAFIKIDVEGFEVAALEGARAILKARRPTIMFEVSAPALARSGQTPDGLFAFLAGFGYAFWSLEDGRFVPHHGGSHYNVFASVEDLAAR